MRVVAAVHTAIFRRTGGRVGGKFPGGAPVLLLHTTGRKTGSGRTTPLVYSEDGDDLVLIASAGGAAKHPAWWRTCGQIPRRPVQVGRDVLSVRAEEVTGDERERLWAKAVEVSRATRGIRRRPLARYPSSCSGGGMVHRQSTDEHERVATAQGDTSHGDHSIQEERTIEAGGSR
jgi:deazaflavin-dependent oxidoreductase (nitroreductase family)